MLNAINEVLRIETVIQGFSRVLTEDHTVDGITMPAGSRVLVLYGSANRDERQFAGSGPLRHHPDQRLGAPRPRLRDPLLPGWQPGPHGDAGPARRRSCSRVERFELVEVEPKLNNVLHGLGTCVVTVA